MAFGKHVIPLVVRPSNAIITQTTIDLFLSKVREGFSLSAAAKSLAIKGQAFVSLMEQVKKEDLNKAMSIGAETLVDEAGEALKNADTKEEVEKAKALAQHNRWLASKLNREKYGESTVKTPGNEGQNYTFNFLLSGAVPVRDEKTIKTVSEQKGSIEDVNKFLTI